VKEVTAWEPVKLKVAVAAWSTPTGKETSVMYPVKVRAAAVPLSGQEKTIVTALGIAESVPKVVNHEEREPVSLIVTDPEALLKVPAVYVLVLSLEQVVSTRLSSPKLTSPDSTQEEEPPMLTVEPTRENFAMIGRVVSGVS